MAAHAEPVVPHELLLAILDELPCKPLLCMRAVNVSAAPPSLGAHRIAARIPSLDRPLHPPRAPARHRHR